MKKWLLFILLLPTIVGCSLLQTNYVALESTRTPLPTWTSTTTTTNTPTDTATPTSTTTSTLTATPTATATRTVTPTPVPTGLPSLYVDGPFIRRADTQQPVTLKGVAVVTFADRDGQGIADSTRRKLQLTAGWNMNLVRLSLDVQELTNRPQSIADLSNLVDWLGKNGMYAILDPHVIGNKMPALPNARVATAMGRLAAAMRNKTNVLCGLWNEPANVTWGEWQPLAVQIAAAIRQAKPDCILVVAGTQWATDLIYLQTHTFPYKNVVYDVHDYWLPNAYPRPRWKWAVGKMPIIFGEFGGGSSSVQNLCPWQSKCDTDYMRQVIDIVNANSPFLHYTAWRIEAGAGDGLFYGQGQLNTRGQLIFQDLTANPPTNMTGHSD